MEYKFSVRQEIVRNQVFTIETDMTDAQVEKMLDVFETKAVVGNYNSEEMQTFFEDNGCKVTELIVDEDGEINDVECEDLEVLSILNR